MPPPSGMPFVWQHGMSLGVQTEFDGDGLADAFAYRLERDPIIPGLVCLYAYVIPSTTGEPSPGVVIPLVQAPAAALTAGDFNGDGADDLLTGFQGDSRWRRAAILGLQRRARACFRGAARLRGDPIGPERKHGAG